MQHRDLEIGKRIARLCTYVTPEVRNAIIDTAEREVVTLGELVGMAMAAYLGRPELDNFPRLVPGRKPTRTRNVS